ncbi:MAG: GNAT family N-acetyltransferase [Acidobacteriota bacterium]|nr:GNAT family N-acetyltransferase [Acidobacteriota bacterium]MDQ7088606.1 GNAT family N-acetyltransferase [Acidobacteriota bacterium]
MRLSIIDHPAELASIGEAWRQLEQADPPSVIGTFHFLSAWCRQRLGEDQLQVLVFHQGSECVGIAPLMIAQRRMGPLRVPTLLYLSRNGYVPGARLLARPDAREIVAEALVDHLLHRDRPWHAVRLNNIEPGGPLEATIRRRQEDGARINFGPDEGSATIPLPADWQELMAGFRRDRRKTLRNKTRRMEEELGLENRAVRDLREMLPALDECFAVSARSWQGRAGTGIDSNAPSRAFYRDLLTDYARRGQARIQLLRAGGRAVAFELSLAHRDTHYALKTGYDEAFKEYGPGVIVEAAAFRAALEAGDRRVELFHPASQAKLAWGVTSKPFRRVTLFTGSLSGRLLQFARSGRQRALATLRSGA